MSTAKPSAPMKRGRSMRKFTRGWRLMSPTQRTYYPATLLETSRTDSNGFRTATFRYRAAQRRRLL